jgi:hypothetical protein
MTISDDRTIADIQKEFSEKFPFLKLEFYSKWHEAHELSPTNERLDAWLTLAQARKRHNTGTIHINGLLQVNTLEQQFHEMFGLNVQVHRKSGNLWLQTSKTDDWTLAEQNRVGSGELE